MGDRLVGGRGTELARCWEEVRERARRGERLSEWKREKQSFGKRGTGGDGEGEGRGF